VLLDNLDGTTGAITVNGPKGQILVNRSRFGASLDGSTQACIFDQSLIETDFGAAISARPQVPVTLIVYFEGAGTALSDGAQEMIAKAMAALVGRAAPDISIIGHTDTLGSAEANEMLGLQRAQLIAKLLAAAGLTVADLTVDTHGEFNLQVKTADETPEPRNRRVEITIR
jgi:outer membrane protein OmpA-like peptidoglycan-associated protein